MAVNIERLHSYMPAHMAFNCALLIRNVRSAFQIDAEDHEYVQAVIRGLKRVAGAKVEHLTHGSKYTLLRLAESKLPPPIEAAWKRLRANAYRTKTERHKDVGVVLGLKCPASDLFDGRAFVVVMAFSNSELNQYWNFKQQMCTSSKALPRLWKELAAYEEVASQMGFDVAMMQLKRKLTKGSRALELGPYLNEE